MVGYTTFRQKNDLVICHSKYRNYETYELSCWTMNEYDNTSLEFALLTEFSCISMYNQYTVIIASGEGP